MPNSRTGADRSSKAQKPRKALLEELDKTAAALQSSESELQQAREQLDQMTQEVSQVKAELDELKQLNQELRSQNESLDRRLRQAEEDSARQAEAAKTEKREAERRRLQYQTEIERLQRTIAVLQEEEPSRAEHPEEHMPEDFAAAKASFRIDLYPRQGQYQGRIEHTLTRDKRAFRGVDQEAIAEFISSHLPTMEAEVSQTAAVEEPPESTAAESSQARPPLMTEAKILAARSPRPTRVLHSGEPFAVWLTVNPADLVAQTETPLSYKAALYAKRLGGGEHRLIGETLGAVKSADQLTIHVDCVDLPPDLYRLECMVTFQQPEGEEVSAGTFLRCGLLQVY